MKKIYTGLVLLASFSMVTSLSADADEKKVETAVSSSSVDQKVKEQLNGQKSKRVLAFVNGTDQAVTVNGTKIEKKSKALISFGPEEVIVKAAFEGNPEKQISDLSDVPAIFQDEQISLAIITKKGDRTNLNLGIIYGDDRQMPGNEFLSFKRDPAVLGRNPVQYTFCNRLGEGYQVVVRIGTPFSPGAELDIVDSLFVIKASSCKTYFASSGRRVRLVHWDSSKFKPTKLVTKLIANFPQRGPIKYLKTALTSSKYLFISPELLAYRMPLLMAYGLIDLRYIPIILKNFIKLGRLPDSLEEVLSKKQIARIKEHFQKAWGLKEEVPSNKSATVIFKSEDGTSKAVIE